MRATTRLTVTFLVSSIGCGGGGTDIITPPPPPATEFVLTFVPDPEEAATSTSLGWQNAIPGVSGSIVPADSSLGAKSFTATAQGKVAFAGLTSGTYIVEGARWLTPTEESRLAAGDDAIGYAGRWTVQVSAGSGNATLETPASRRKGLVISEWAFNRYGYAFGGFLELHNNADTAIHLDGMIIGEGYNASLVIGDLTCANTAPLRNDPQGIWTRVMSRFPGSGRDYPVLPGQTVVVATDAIDHRPLEARSLDLSNADFEILGPADVDNPSVPNLVEVGIAINPQGHGPTGFGLVHVPFLALPLDVASLPRTLGSGGTAEFARVPASHILDAFALGSNYLPPAGPEDCPPLVSSRFDRKESRARGTDDFVEFVYSVSRRSVPASAGRDVLQWTRTGFADLVRTSRTPGTPGAP